MNNMTGRLRYRSTITGKLILQIAEQMGQIDPQDFSTLPSVTIWRDARVEDFASLGLLPFPSAPNDA